jgi:hypothetical protein
MGRYKAGQDVWISPNVSGHWLNEDAGIVLDDVGDGYLVLQIAERMPSGGLGHFVQDAEVQDLAA